MVDFKSIKKITQPEKFVSDYLFENRDGKYQKFASSLLPNVENVLGVRLPILRQIAKLLYKQCNTEYLKHHPQYMEEVLIQGFIIGLMNEPVELVVEQIKNFIPQITNWSICDSFISSLKIIKQHKELFWAFIQPYLLSDKEFEIRFGLVVLLNYYIEEDYLSKIFDLLETITLKDYYAQMGAAWLISICYKKFPEHTTEYLKRTQIDEFTHKKALQKIKELS